MMQGSVPKGHVRKAQAYLCVKGEQRKVCGELEEYVKETTFQCSLASHSICHLMNNMLRQNTKTQLTMWLLF